ncbi:hypothetical protein [Sphingomonas sp. URHD0057]|uniref:hypothetical protein n=1 Tax=Sphingomonas sp. URHD0057 TaxID=1380389 RepID=UPI0012DF0C10|nr:hypothetical protein [Sphingomonas sp. URHD0057]
MESYLGKWTNSDDYVAALARKRTARRGRGRGREASRRTQPESPRFGLSTLPYLALIAGLAVLTVAIAVAAFPGSQPEHKAPQLPPHEQGTAVKGWLQEAQREFHR